MKSNEDWVQVLLDALPNNPTDSAEERERKGELIATLTPHFICFAGHDQLIQYCQWNDANGDYDECDEWTLQDIIKDWQLEYETGERDRKLRELMHKD